MAEFLTDKHQGRERQWTGLLDISLWSFVKTGVQYLERFVALHSFQDLSPSHKRLWLRTRRFVPRRTRFFYEGCISVPGQLWYRDRVLLYETVRRYQPRVVFEAGTWLGGGNTYFIASALYLNGFGILHTVESDPKIHRRAVENYCRCLPKLIKHVKFHKGVSTQVYPEILRQAGSISMVFLDGSPNAKETESEFEMFRPHLRGGSILSAHDWFNQKMALLRPVIEGSGEWDVKRILTPPASVGLMIAIRNLSLS